MNSWFEIFIQYRNLVIIKTRNSCSFKYSDKCNIFCIFPFFIAFFKSLRSLTFFFSQICRPTYEFPHPLARVPQSAGYWVCPLLKQYFIIWFWYFCERVDGLHYQQTCFNISLYPDVLYNCGSTNMVGDERNYQWLQKKEIEACSYCILQHVPWINISFTNRLYVESSCCSKAKWYGQGCNQ